MSVVLDAIRLHARETPDRPALASGTTSLTYAGLAEEIFAVARTISPHLAEAPGCVAVRLANGAPWVLLDLALLVVRRASLPLPGFFTAEQIAHALADSGADWLIDSVGPGTPVEIAGATLFLRRLSGAAGRLPPETAKVTYTSGSTGAPKGICLTRAQMDAVAQSIVTRLGGDYAGVHMPLLPLAILLENVAGLYPMFIAGGCCRVEAPAAIGFADPFRPDFAQLGRALTAHGVTSLILVPELLRGMLAARWFGVMDCSPLKYIAVGGAKVAPELVASARAAGLPVYEGYGLSECASVVAVNTPHDDRAGSVGRPLPHVDVTIAADGEIVVGPDTLLSHAGEAPRYGRVFTGDLGHLDADGFLHVTGRKANRIITSFGRNVSPEWVESELLAEPQIRHAIVCGEGCAALSALIAPTVAELGEAEIAPAVARANERLPAYARIAHFHVIAPLSAADGVLTGNGRPRRAALLARYAALINTNEVSPA